MGNSTHLRTTRRKSKQNVTRITRTRIETALLFATVLAVIALTDVLNAANSPEVPTTTDITDSQATMNAIMGSTRPPRHVARGLTLS